MPSGGPLQEQVCHARLHPTHCGELGSVRGMPSTGTRAGTPRGTPSTGRTLTKGTMLRTRLAGYSAWSGWNTILARRLSLTKPGHSRETHCERLANTVTGHDSAHTAQSVVRKPTTLPVNELQCVWFYRDSFRQSGATDSGPIALSDNSPLYLVGYGHSLGTFLGNGTTQQGGTPVTCEHEGGHYSRIRNTVDALRAFESGVHAAVEAAISAISTSTEAFVQMCPTPQSQQTNAQYSPSPALGSTALQSSQANATRCKSDILRSAVAQKAACGNLELTKYLFEQTGKALPTDKAGLRREVRRTMGLMNQLLQNEEVVRRGERHSAMWAPSPKLMAAMTTATAEVSEPVLVRSTVTADADPSRRPWLAPRREPLTQLTKGGRSGCGRAGNGARRALPWLSPSLEPSATPKKGHVSGPETPAAGLDPRNGADEARRDSGGKGTPK
jgi:hypothetical protein